MFVSAYIYFDLNPTWRRSNQFGALSICPFFDYSIMCSKEIETTNQRSSTVESKNTCSRFPPPPTYSYYMIRVCVFFKIVYRPDHLKTLAVFLFQTLAFLNSAMSNGFVKNPPNSTTIDNSQAKPKPKPNLVRCAIFPMMLCGKNSQRIVVTRPLGLWAP